jgi:hypothetical protein
MGEKVLSYAVVAVGSALFGEVVRPMERVGNFIRNLGPAQSYRDYLLFKEYGGSDYANFKMRVAQAEQQLQQAK